MEDILKEIPAYKRDYIIDKSLSLFCKVLDTLNISSQEIQEILCGAVASEGKELYTSQDGCYAEYEYGSFVYVLRFDPETNTKSISKKGEE